MHHDFSGDQYARIARELGNAEGVIATLDSAVATAVEIVDGCDHAGISLVRKRGRIETVAGTDDVVTRANELQLEANEGPCLQSNQDEDTVYVRDLRIESRWSKWSARAADELGIRSALVLQLHVGPKSLGCLALYSDGVDAFRSESRMSALALAAHVAVAVRQAQGEEDSESAVAGRTVIGQAEGMLMQKYGLTPDQAFAALVRLSQSGNTKLSAIAAEIVRDGIQPSLFELVAVKRTDWSKEVVENRSGESTTK